MSVKISHLTKMFDEQKAVNDISFEVGSGEVVGFLGPNGAGKTTTMKIITGFLPQTEGTVEVCGHDVNSDTISVKRVTGYLPENNPLYEDMYIREYLQFAAKLNKIDSAKSRINEMMDRTGLNEEGKKKIGQLSKGFKQRVGLAQAMLHDPQVLILDEPTSGLDPNQVVGMRAMIKELGKEKTVILSTHIMQEVQAICNRVIIINKGSIVADDTADNLRKEVSGETVLIVTFDKEADIHSLEALNGITKVETNEDLVYRLFASTDADIRTQVFEFAVANDLKLLNMQEEQRSLEEIFRKLTQE